MRLSWILYVARRYFRTKRKEKGHASSVLSVAGIAVGVMTLLAVLGVMNGFQMGFIEDILEISSYHIRILPGEDGAFSGNDAETVRAMKGVRGVLPFLEVQTMARGVFSEPHGVMLRGVPRNADVLDPGMLENLNVLHGSFDLSRPGSIIIGSELARSLGIRVGSEVSLLALGGSGRSRGISSALRAEDIPFTVTGIFHSGYYLFDLTWGIISLEDAELFTPSAARPVWGVKLNDRYADGRMAERIQSVLSGKAVNTVSWREYNRAFFGALRMEKIMMMFLLGLIFVVVGVNIFHSLRRSVYEKTEDIGVLRTVGADPASIQAIFVTEGFFVGVLGGVIGLISGLLVASRINEVFEFLELLVNSVLSLVTMILQPFFPGTGGEAFTLFSPMYFYITEVPSRVLFSEALFIFLFALLSSTGAAYAASRKVASVKPADVLRYE